ncbi:MAG: hypothetical protein ACREQR_00295 [Candidatus Binataceae bacterium]
MDHDAAAIDSFLKLADSLGELEIVIGPAARPAVAEVRDGLRQAVAMRDRGDMPAAIAAIRRAMERLAGLGAELDPAEGAMMRAIAERFAAAMSFGDKGEAKGAVNLMRHKAGDTRKDGGDSNEW